MAVVVVVGGDVVVVCGDVALAVVVVAEMVDVVDVSARPPGCARCAAPDSAGRLAATAAPPRPDPAPPAGPPR